MDRGDVGFGGLYGSQDTSCMNEERFTFLRQHQPPRRPVQELGPDAALQPGDDARNTRGGQFDLSAHGGEAPQINCPDESREIRHRVHQHIHDFLAAVFRKIGIYLRY